MFFAEQLNHTNAEILYLDFSKASMEIAKNRAKIRGLHNIVWITSWIEGIIKFGIGKLDYCESAGVLHHLKSPLRGLNTLKDILTENGGMEIMVYAKYGRTYIYQMQRLFQTLDYPKQSTISEELKNVKIILNALPENNLFQQLMVRYKDVQVMGDVGVYDLLLHKRDVSFSILDVHKWVGIGGMSLLDFAYYKSRLKFNIDYVIHDEIILNMLRKKNLMSHKRAICEIIHADIIKHEIYLSKHKNAEASIHDPANLIYIYGAPRGFRQALSNQNNYQRIGNQTYFYSRMYEYFFNSASINSTRYLSTIRSSPSYDVTMIFRFPVNEYVMFLIDKLTESNKGTTLLDSFTSFTYSMNSTLTNTELFEVCKRFYYTAKDTGMFLLKKRRVGTFPKTHLLTSFQIYSI